MSGIGADLRNKVWAVQSLKIQQYKVWRLSTQQFDSFTSQAQCAHELT